MERDMSEFLDGQNLLISTLEDLAEEMKFSVYDGAVPTGATLVSTNGRFWPYAIFALGGKTEAANRMQGITSSREDVKWTSLVFYCVGDTPATVRTLKDVLREKFEGFIVGPGWGELTEVLSGDFGISKPDPDLIPLRFGETLAFKFLTSG